MYPKTFSKMKTRALWLALALILLASCSSNRSYIEENLDGVPDYLEETQLSIQDNQEIMEELQRLNNLELPDYRLGPGDKMKIYVYDEPELDTDVVLVKQDGTISFRLVGEVPVTNLTIPEVIDTLEARLQKYILHPQVSVIPFEARSSSVTLLGKVTHPGIFEIKGRMRVLDALASAGGLALGYFQNNTVELADLERTFLIRDNQLLPIDFVELVQNGDTRYNIPILDRDYIYVPSAVNREIYIIGEVNQQGHYFYQEGMTLMQSITFAQGFTTSAQSTIYVIRGNLTHPRLFKIKTRDIMRAEVRDFRLMPNDIVFIPRSPIARWNDVIAAALPSLQAIQAAWFANDLIQNFNP